MKHGNTLWLGISFGIFLSCSTFLLAQQSPVEAAEESDLISIAFPNMPIPLILNEYEELTGKRIVRDNAVLGGALSIETTRKLTRKEAARFIEQSFLLNGFAFIPAGDDTLKIIAFSGGRNPGSEGVPIITQIEELPKDGESVVTFILPLKDVNPEDAVRTLGTIFPVHQYGQFTPLPEASSIALTENTSVIRKILEVVKKIDLPPSQIEHKTITLERADAEEVAEALVEILELDSKDAQPTGTLQAAQRSLVLQTGDNIVPNAVQVGNSPSVSAGTASQSFKPRIRAIPRANRLLVVARPVDMAYIESLVAHFDEPLKEKVFVKYKLNYLTVSTFLPIVKDSLLRGLGGEEAQQVQISGGITAQQNTLSGEVLLSKGGLVVSAEGNPLVLDLEPLAEAQVSMVPMDPGESAETPLVI